MDKVLIDYSLSTEAKRVAHTMYGISTGFYISNKWYVLPVKKLNKAQSIVFMPDVDYKLLINIVQVLERMVTLCKIECYEKPQKNKTRRTRAVSNVSGREEKQK